MPMISMDGTLMSTLYLKSSESSLLGKGNDPQFPSTTVIPPGIKAYPGTSAMMNKSDLQMYLREVFFAQLRQSNIDKCLLLCDSWSSNKDDASFNQIAADFPDIVVKRMLIPPGTTGTTQPLDVYYFRSLKVFIRFICDTLEIDDFKIWQRNNYFKLQAFAHFQFRADRFRNMIRYAFYKAGYLPERPPKFVTPCDYCFRFSELDCCSFESCSNMSDFKCAHCEQFFCFYHCIINELHINCQ